MPDPFMLKVYPVRPSAGALILATTHVDGTGRLQTVSRDENPLYHDLIAEFERQTGIPVILTGQPRGRGAPARVAGSLALPEPTPPHSPLSLSSNR